MVAEGTALMGAGEGGEPLVRMQKRHSVWTQKGFMNKDVGVNLEAQVKARVGESRPVSAFIEP